MKIRHKRKKYTSESSEVSMTPMIDVVFQLLIYFLVTFTTPDVLAQLDVSRPQVEEAKTTQNQPVQMIKIRIEQKRFLLNGRDVSLEELTSVLNRLAELDKTQTVLITCVSESEHVGLVTVLDSCAECGLSKISVTSTDG